MGARNEMVVGVGERGMIQVSIYILVVVDGRERRGVKTISYVLITHSIYSGGG